jgi:hypothetical protein
MIGRNQKSAYKISWLENLKGLHWFRYYSRLFFSHLPCIQFVVYTHTHKNELAQVASHALSQGNM